MPTVHLCPLSIYAHCWFIQGAYVGDAAGIKITSLLKLSELRSNKPRVNLLHVVVMQAEKYKPDLLKFFDGMKYLKNTTESVPPPFSSVPGAYYEYW